MIEKPQAAVGGKDQKRRFLRRGIVTLLYTGLIFATLPVFPAIWGFLFQKAPNLLQALTHVGMPLLAVSCLVYAALKKRERDPLFYLWSGLFFFSYVPLVYFYCEFPAERLHMAEYGLLVFLAYWTLKVRMNTGWIYVMILLYSLAVGSLDEVVQGILPNRVYEFKDITINWISSFFAAALLVGFTWERFAAPSTTKRLRRWAIGVICIMLFVHGAFFYHKYWRPPLNVILLSVDTFRPDHLGCYGYHRDTSPFLDRVARQGMLFKNVISSAPWTSPGMISIFTGLYPSTHGVQGRGKHLLPGTPTLFTLFQEHGYAVPNISYLTEIANFSHLGLEAKEPEYLQEASQPGDELLRWLDDHHRQRFVVWYHYRFLHLPFVTRCRNPFLTKEMEAHLASDALKTVQKESVIPHGSVSFRSEEKETVVALYDGQLRELDQFVERLFAKLTRWKLHRNTLLVITADHGEELFEHGFIGHASTALHATMFDEVLKIPLILYAPSRFQGGRVVEDQVRQVDIMPTILDVVGIPIPESIHGRSLLPGMKGRGGVKPQPAISESVSAGYQSTPEQEKIMFRSIRTDSWKLVSMEGGEASSRRLYELQQDPGETRDLARAEPQTAAELEERLYGSVARMQAQRLKLLAEAKVTYGTNDIPPGVRLERPVILSPKDEASIKLQDANGRMVLHWTGGPDLEYVIQYDVGEGWRNLKGSLPVHGNRKTFGPLPREAWEPLPYWNPYRIRVAPYGLEEYWSEWVEFRFADDPDND